MLIMDLKRLIGRINGSEIVAKTCSAQSFMILLFLGKAFIASILTREWRRRP